MGTGTLWDDSGGGVGIYKCMPGLAAEETLGDAIRAIQLQAGEIFFRLRKGGMGGLAGFFGLA